jgi:hypothetical protein
MTATSAAVRGQRLAEVLMTDTCTVTRPSGEQVFDEDTGEYTQGTTTLYTGKCRVRPMPNSSDRQVEAGDAAVEIWPFTVSLPMTATGIKASDKVTITASDDPGLVDRVLVVRSVAFGSQITARRLGCDVQET